MIPFIIENTNFEDFPTKIKRNFEKLRYLRVSRKKHSELSVYIAIERYSESCEIWTSPQSCDAFLLIFKFG